MLIFSHIPTSSPVSLKGKNLQQSKPGSTGLGRGKRKRYELRKKLKGN